jgi:hypothetical protein
MNGWTDGRHRLGRFTAARRAHDGRRDDHRPRKKGVLPRYAMR